AVNTPIGASGVTPYKAYGRLLRLKQHLNGIEMPVLDTSEMQQWTTQDFKEREAIVEQLQSLIARMGLPSGHPFWGSKRKVFLPNDKPRIIRAAETALDATQSLRASAHALAEALGLEAPDTPAEASILCRA